VDRKQRSKPSFNNFLKYFYLAKKYTISIPLTYKPKSFMIDSLILVSTVTFGADIEQNTIIAQLLITDKNDKTSPWDIKAGKDTSDWAWDSVERASCSPSLLTFSLYQIYSCQNAFNLICPKQSKVVQSCQRCITRFPVVCENNTYRGRVFSCLSLRWS